MEERAPPPSPPPPLPPRGPDLPATDPLPLSPAVIYRPPHETLIVQAPKDQIFRIPPPEHARIAEEYRARRKKNKDTASCLHYLYWLLSIAFAVTILCLISWLVFYTVVRPRPPDFTIQRFIVVVNPKSPPQYTVTIKANNPSGRLTYTFDTGGKAILSDHGKHVATGAPPDFDILPGNEMTFKQVLRGSKGPLSKELEKSLHGSKNSIAAVSLAMELPVSSKVWVLQWMKKMNVECKIEALAKEGVIVSQKCDVKDL